MRAYACVRIYNKVREMAWYAVDGVGDDGAVCAHR